MWNDKYPLQKALQGKWGIRVHQYIEMSAFLSLVLLEEQLFQLISWSVEEGGRLPVPTNQLFDRGNFSRT